MESRSRALVGGARHHDHVRTRRGGRLVEHLATGALDDVAQGGGRRKHGWGDEHGDAVQETGVAVACMSECNTERSSGLAVSTRFQVPCACVDAHRNAVRACVHTIAELESEFRLGVWILELVRFCRLKGVFRE